MNQKEIIHRYWMALRYAIENYVAAVEQNQNAVLIRCLGRVVTLRESELDKAEGK